MRCGYEEHFDNRNITTMTTGTIMIVDQQPPLDRAPKSPTMDRLTASAKSIMGLRCGSLFDLLSFSNS